jgi:cytochrome c6
VKRLIFSVSYVCIFATLVSAGPTMAKGDEGKDKEMFKTGEKVFEMAGCNACHAGGGNMINPAKTLSKSHLIENGRFSADGLYNVIANGVDGSAMVSFKDRLSDGEIKAVAHYVMERAEKDWK